jgi:hypothetical protein
MVITISLDSCSGHLKVALILLNEKMVRPTEGVDIDNLRCPFYELVGFKDRSGRFGEKKKKEMLARVVN